MATAIQAQPPIDRTVDFESSIRPIFERHCFECHSGDQADGDLRLDSKIAMARGGHTGNPILGSTVEDSELLRRIVSEEDGYRMPKQGPALSQPEIDLIRNWIVQGASWTGAAKKSAARKRSIDSLGEFWFRLESQLQQPRFRYLPWIAGIGGLWLILMLFYGVRKRRRVGDDGSSGSSRDPRFARFFLQLGVMVSLIGAGWITYQNGRVSELLEENAQLVQKLNQQTATYEVSLDPENLTIPPYPMHPKRLGGVYYRGNDERGAELFNGGFYRTACLEVWVTDAAGNRYRWDDQVLADELFITFAINRAAGTTESLFSEYVMNSTYVRHFPKDTQSAAATVKSTSTDADNATELQPGDQLLTTSEPGQRWETRISLGLPASWNGGVAEGMIYVFHGAHEFEGHRGRVHYGIPYRIAIVDQRISTESELWMGSLYNLNGRVLVPSEKTLLLDRWFDFRPIPEIEGTNTTDPKLLGIPEHVK